MKRNFVQQILIVFEDKKKDEKWIMTLMPALVPEDHLSLVLITGTLKSINLLYHLFGIKSEIITEK